jgi:septal ring factor EnvC (AmiA/AmiB activator)
MSADWTVIGTLGGFLVVGLAGSVGYGELRADVLATKQDVAEVEKKVESKVERDSEVRERLVRLEEGIKGVREEVSSSRATSERIERKLDRDRRER